MPSEPILEFRDVSFSFEDQPVLEEVNLAIGHDDYLAVLGPNGGGKTTLLRLALGLLRPSSGEVRVFGKPAGRHAVSVGYVPQNPDLARTFPITVLQATLLGLVGKTRGWSFSASQRQRAIRVLAQVGLAGQERRRMQDLSGGQRQRVLIARALVDEPRLLLMDEPTSYVDAYGKFCFYELLADLSRDVTVVVVSHDLSILASKVTAVACVNRKLSHHRGNELTPEMLSLLYGGHEGHQCPIMSFARDLPRVVAPSPSSEGPNPPGPSDLGA